MSGREEGTYEVVAVRYGTRTTRRSECFFEYRAYGEPDAELEMAFYFWLLRGGGQTIVVDTGFHPSVGVQRGRTCLCEPAEALARLGVDPGAVSHVVLTHLHYDHTGNVSLFPNAQLVVGRRELDFWASPASRHPPFAMYAEPDEIAHVLRERARGRVKELAEAGTVAPGVRAIQVGGHTPGQLVIVVDAHAGQVVLASDAAHYYEEIERDRPFSIVADLEKMYAAYETLRRLSRASPELLVAGHDPLVMTRFPAVSGNASGIAVRIA